MELKVFCYTGPERELSLTLQNCLKQSPCCCFFWGGGWNLKVLDHLSFKLTGYFGVWNRKQKQAKIC